MKTTTEISNSEDIIDSRDVIARIEYLESEIENIDDMPEGDLLKDTEEGAEMREELEKLKAFADEAEGCASDWHYGEALIRDSHFEDYARELADEIGAIPDNAQWPCTCIDWEKAARELQTDYSAVDFDGVTYWTR